MPIAICRCNNRIKKYLQGNQNVINNAAVFLCCEDKHFQNRCSVFQDKMAYMFKKVKFIPWHATGRHGGGTRFRQSRNNWFRYAAAFQEICLFSSVKHNNAFRFKKYFCFLQLSITMSFVSRNTSTSFIKQNNAFFMHIITATCFGLFYRPSSGNTTRKNVSMSNMSSQIMFRPIHTCVYVMYCLVTVYRNGRNT